MTSFINGLSQDISKIAKCVKDFSINKDTLTIIIRQSNCDSIFYSKIQIYQTEKGLFNKMFHDIKLKTSKKCYDQFKINIKGLNFKSLCTSDFPIIQNVKQLEEYEVKIRKCKKSNSDLTTNFIFYISSKNKTFKNNKCVDGLNLATEIKNHIACLLIDTNDKSTGH